MKTIWKFPFDVEDDIEIEMPEYAYILHVESQLQYETVVGNEVHRKEQPHIWALVNTDRPKVKRQFILVGTGGPMPESHGEHVGSFQIHDGKFVWHVFEKA